MTVALDLDDIQAGCLRGRPNPYFGAFMALRIGNPVDGRTLMRRLAEVVHSAADVLDPRRSRTFSVGLTATGLRALGVPDELLATFAPEFVQGMAARANELGDHGTNAPDHWEEPWGREDVHAIIVLLAPDQSAFEETLESSREVLDGLPGIGRVWRQDVRGDADGRNSFGFNDGISQPAVESSGIPGTNPGEVPLKPGEFVLGYPDETGSVAAIPQPETLGRNGSYLAVRKLYTDVAAFRRYLRERAESPAEEALMAAKIVGRWPSGAPLALTPDVDDHELGADPERNNDFMYGDDPRGLSSPVGSHARRMNPRDAVVTGEVRLHRLLRRGATYGPPLGEGVLEDDGADRGLLFAAVFAHPARQFEFVQKQWIGDGKFIGSPIEADPLVAGRDAGDQFTVPMRPVRKRLTEMPAFVVNRGGEYCFVPSLSALRWLGALDSNERFPTSGERS
ncbi:Dyp-type peroxidase [Nocardioides sp. NPDC127503]|uniref:Dyp-type peroxidase n=1 Tax=Nocardioides sp. NPDC127503 TaxID=3154516 RepID=UPI00332979EF